MACKKDQCRFKDCWGLSSVRMTQENIIGAKMDKLCPPLSDFLHLKLRVHPPVPNVPTILCLGLRIENVSQ